MDNLDRPGNMMPWLIAYSATLLSAVMIDAVWLSQMSDVLYRPIMGEMLLDNFVIAPAAAFYVIYAAGLVFFAIDPALKSGKWSMAAARGAALGLVSYGTYDLTNQATLKNWSTLLTVTDLSWGEFLSSATSVIGYLAASRSAK